MQFFEQKGVEHGHSRFGKTGTRYRIAGADC
jgi:hypothetical protein